MAAAVQWVLKDGVGHLGAIAYAASVNTKFDSDAKRYRFASTVALTVADFVAVLMPLVPQHFFVLASLSSTTSSIANLAQVAARARIMSSFARFGNLADCVRAGQTQGKLMSVLGTGSGAALSWAIGPETLHVMAAMVPLAGVSLYATYASSALVVLKSLNVQRAERTFASLIEQHEARSPSLESPPLESPPLEAPTPGAVAEAETFAWPYATVLSGELWLQPIFRHPGSTWLPVAAASKHLHEALPALHAALDAAEREAAEREAAKREAAQWREEPSGSDAQGPSDAAELTKLRGMWHASLLRWGMRRPKDAPASSSSNGEGGHRHRHRHDDPRASVTAHLAESRAIVDATWPEVHAALSSAGWDLSVVHLDGDGGVVEVTR